MGRNSWGVRWAKGRSVSQLERFVSATGRTWERRPERVSGNDRVKLAAARHVLKLPPDPRLPDIAE